LSTLIQPVTVAEDLFTIGNGQLALIAGPCVVEDLAFTRSVAEQIAEIAVGLGISYCFKASYDKANRSALEGHRGPGREEGLAILAAVKESTGLPIITDVHETTQVRMAAEVVDYLQIPAFLCRQTDLLIAAGETGKPVNIKKGQFAAPEDMTTAAAKVAATGNKQITLTERGTTFGYHNLVVDMRSLVIMHTLGHPVIFDATHSVQLPSGLGGRSGGQRQFVPPLLRAAVATGIDGLFLEVHPDPDHAPCDGPNMLPLPELRRVLETALRIHDTVKESL
jgi:2-dehydro-3-deoxyphosphooctonate aldolase (KDO 8-P synthase)